ncbi:putative ABC transporter ATP-binding protein [Gordonia hirsuta DSM 44140 = NBRC 16056]|uniref:Putative ABC transporter ATP-binding protein n=1 Tax=Gordonia hirsuta DSM 44140 = NBRC 16056 TaxID=1121927 RepID=L7LDE2_9ACTN|nr:ABC transporter ATP-binding protein [Gordonia hirsuta]GAC58077.1 putative ABC transporter ATP-binding protein [Gordonia hirsuta DSM 44140 = NBRC 16056]
MSLQMSAVDLTYPDGDDRRVQALAEVSLTVAPGEVIALTGPSGCGKSSALAVAGTLIRPDSGTVAIDGTEVGGLSEQDRARIRREQIGFVFQRDNLLPDLTALEQLLLTAHLRGERPARHRGEALDLLADVGLAGHHDKLPRQLSGGMRQRVNIARALMGPRRVLLIDEPTSALDHARGTAIVELICQLARERGLAALLVTHDLATLEGNADGLLHMLDGRLTDVAVAV